MSIFFVQEGARSLAESRELRERRGSEQSGEVLNCGEQNTHRLKRVAESFIHALFLLQVLLTSHSIAKITKTRRGEAISPNS